MKKNNNVLLFNEYKQNKINETLSAEEIANHLKHSLKMSNLAGLERKLSSIFVWSLVGFIVILFGIGILHPSNNNQDSSTNYPYSYPVKKSK